MSDAVILVSKYTDKPLPCYIVKNGRKTFAKIYPPNEFHALFYIEMSHVIFDRIMSLENAFETVKETAERKLTMYGYNNMITIKGDGLNNLSLDKNMYQ